MTQLRLFTDVLTCAFGTLWLHHFKPPIGTGKGCHACDTYHPVEP